MQLMHVALDQVHPAEDNVRERVGDIASLVKSIELFGIIQPLTVRATDDGYEVIAGHRRLAAASKAGLSEVPVILGDETTDADRRGIMLVENLHRQDLSEWETLQGSLDLLDAGMTRKDIATVRGITQKRLRSELKALDLGEQVGELVSDGLMTIDAAIELSEEDLSVDETLSLFDLITERVQDGNPIVRTFGLVSDAKRQVAYDDSYAEVQATLKGLAEKGVTVEWDDIPEKGVKFLVDAKGKLPSHLGRDRMVISIKDHRKESCHAAGAKRYQRWSGTDMEYGYELTEWCTAPNRHRLAGKSDLKMADAEAVEAKKAEVKEERAAKKKAEAIFEARVKSIFSRKISDKVALDFALAIVAHATTADKILRIGAVEKPEGLVGTSAFQALGRDEAKQAIVAHALGLYEVGGWSLTGPGKEWIDGYLDAIEVTIDEEA